MDRSAITIRDAEPAEAGPVCRRILALLPEWFGIEAAVEQYIAAADTHPSVIAAVAGEDVGITTVMDRSKSSRRCGTPITRRCR